MVTLNMAVLASIASALIGVVCGTSFTMAPALIELRKAQETLVRASLAVEAFAKAIDDASNLCDDEEVVIDDEV